jgi:hypothetical protein
MRMDQLEFLYFYFNDEALRAVVDVLDPVVTLGCRANENGDE